MQAPLQAKIQAKPPSEVEKQVTEGKSYNRFLRQNIDAAQFTEIDRTGVFISLSRSNYKGTLEILRRESLSLVMPDKFLARLVEDHVLTKSLKGKSFYVAGKLSAEFETLEFNPEEKIFEERRKPEHVKDKEKTISYTSNIPIESDTPHRLTIAVFPDRSKKDHTSLGDARFDIGYVTNLYVAQVVIGVKSGHELAAASDDVGKTFNLLRAA